MMHTHSAARGGRVAVRPLATPPLAALSLVLLSVLVSFLPGMDRLVRGTPVSAHPGEGV